MAPSVRGSVAERDVNRSRAALKRALRGRSDRLPRAVTAPPLAGEARRRKTGPGNVAELHFLFTDIEGSTRLWEREPERMAEALRDHDALLRSTVEARGGSVFKTVGDAVCAVFPNAAGAVGAAVDGQRALASREWPTSAPLRVRMAIHSGEAAQRDGDYFGQTLNRVARVLAVGHGGQVLATGRTIDLIGAGLPPESETTDLGERRLKDLREPERLFQVTLAEGPRTFPPLKTLDARVHNLPVQPGPLIGRDREIAGVVRAFDDSGTRLLTITGPGGVGKTRLAHQAAAELLDRFADGVRLVNLAPLVSAADVAPAILETVLPGDGGPAHGAAADALRQHLRERELLLVLDNMEHVAEAAPLIAAVLAEAPGVRAIVTSRAPLRIRAERQIPLDPLPSPEPGQVGEWAPGAAPAVDLFIERARAIQPSFATDAEACRAIAAICRRLDGLPLAIELAAGRSRMLAPAAMLARLEKRLPLLGGGARDLPERHQTLRATIAWSADLLAPEERAVFEALSAFRAPASYEAAEHVTGDGASDLFGALERLVEHNLLRMADAADGMPRFDMLQTIREYAGESLAADPARARAVAEAHAGWFRSLARTLKEDGFTPEERGELDAVYPDLLESLDWLETSGGGDDAAALAVDLRWFWYLRGYIERGVRHLSPLWAGSAALTPGVTADGLSTLGLLLGARGDLTEADAVLRAALDRFREAGIDDGALEALENLGESALFRGDLAEAMDLRQQVLDGWRELGREEFVPGALNNLAEVADLAGDPARARELFEEALAACDPNEDPFSAATIGGNLAATIAAAAAEGVLEESSGDVDRAWELACGALRQSEAAASPARASAELVTLAGLSTGEPLEAARLLGAGEAIASAAGVAVSGADAARRARIHAATAARLDPAAFDRATVAGRQLTAAGALGEAVARCERRGQGR
jgi:predicted ATPase/class 3 adenylate cyclase